MEKGIIVHSLVINRGKILILKRAKEGDPLKDYWDFPGGTLEDGEHPISGAQREIWEETGLTLRDPQLFYCVSNIDTQKNKQFITLIFLAKTNIDLKEITISKREHNEFRWIELNEVINYQLVECIRECMLYLESHSYLIG